MTFKRRRREHTWVWSGQPTRTLNSRVSRASTPCGRRCKVRKASAARGGNPDGGNLGTNGTFPYIPQVYVISTPHPRPPASLPVLRRFSFALCLSYHFSASVANSIPSSHFPPTTYSFKVVFRVFRDFHSVPVKPQLCSSWSILHVQWQNRFYVPTGTFSTMFQLEHSASHRQLTNSPTPLLQSPHEPASLRRRSH